MSLLRTQPSGARIAAPPPVPDIPLSVPQLGGNEWAYLKECLDGGWVSSAGPFVTRFEEAVAAYVGAEHAVAVVNGTSGLHIALKVVGVEPDDEVLVSDLTFVAPVNAILYCGAHPVLMDANPGTWQMDADKVERFLEEECTVRRGSCVNRRSGRRVRAMVPVHILGLACEMDRLVELARRFRLAVVEDAAEGMGVRFRGRHVGTFGEVGVLSFNGNKIITTGGGGMVVTRDAGHAQRVRHLTTQAKRGGIEYLHDEVGYNYRLTNIQAALGLAQLEQLGTFIERKRAIAQRYETALRGLERLSVMPRPVGVDATYWLYTVLLDQETTLDERVRVIAHVRARGIEARPLWHPIHALEPYQGFLAYAIEQANDLYTRGICLPSSVGLREEDQARCLAVLKEALTLREAWRRAP